MHFKSLLLISLLFAGSSYSAAGSPWRFTVTPVLWAVKINGDIEVGVPQEEDFPNQIIHFSKDFSDIWKDINSGGMLEITAANDKITMFATGMYVNLTTETVTSDEFEIEVNSKFGLYTAGIAYSIYQHTFKDQSKFSIEPYVGARITNNHSSASLIEDPDLASSYGETWVDPYIGANLRLDFTKSWYISFAGDLGGTSKNQYSYNILALINYQANKYFSVYAGYRNLYQAFNNGNGGTYFDWKMNMSGPILGFSFTF